MQSEIEVAPAAPAGTASAGCQVWQINTCVLVTCRWISVRAPAELLLIVRCVLWSGKVQRKLYSNTENYLSINMQFYLMDFGQFYCLPTCVDWVRFLFLLLFPLPPRVLQQTGSDFSVRQWSYSGFKSWCLEAVLWPGDLAEFLSSGSVTSWCSFLHFTIPSFSSHGHWKLFMHPKI